MITFLFNNMSHVSFQNILKDSANIQKNNSAIVIVPDQYSFYAEKEIQTISEKLKKNITVYSFNRLAYKIFKSYGGIAGNFATKPIKIAILNLILNELKSKLKIYGKFVNSPKFSEMMLATIESVKNSGLTIQEIIIKITQLKPCRLKQKTVEFLQILEYYDSQLKKTFKDPSNNLQYANKLCVKHSFFKNKEIYFEKFFSFSGAQLNLIETIIKQTNAFFSFSYEKDEPLFDAVENTINQLKILAKKNKIPVKESQTIESLTAKSEAILKLENSIMRLNKPKKINKYYNEPTNDIKIYFAKDEYDEIAYVLSEIEKLVRNNLNYSDIAIFAENLKDYRMPLTSALKNYSIPFFMDDTNFADGMVLINCCKNIVSIANKFNINGCLNILKSDLCKFSPEEIAAFENYIYVWSIDEKTFFNEFNNVTKWFEYSKNHDEDHEKDKLEKIKIIQKTIICIVNMFKTCKNNTKSFSNKLLKAVEILEINKYLKRKELTSDERKNFLNEWNMLIHILETIYCATKDIDISIEQYELLFEYMAKATEINQIPKSLNSVLIGSIEKSIPTNPKIVFIIGANDGNLSMQHSEFREIFSQTDILQFENINLKLSKSLKEKNALGLLLAFRAITSPKDKLYISLKTSDIFNNEFKQSEIVTEIIEIFGKEVVENWQDQDIISRCVNKKTAIITLAANFSKNTAEIRALKKYFKENTKNKPITKTNGGGKTKAKNLLKLFEKTISPSQVEQFYFCPFSYFCRYGLQLQPLEKVKFNLINKGIIFHKLLEKITSLKNFIGFNCSKLKEEIEKELKKILANELGGKTNKSKKFLNEYFSLTDILLYSFKNIQQELLNSKFKPTEFEAIINNKSKLRPLKLEICKNLNINVEGKIDRIDILRENSEIYLRIIDYKSRKKAINFSDIFYGHNLQMLIYLDIVYKSIAAKKNIHPIGIFYIPIIGAMQTYSLAKRNASIQDFEKTIKKGFTATGLLINSNTNSKAIKKASNENFISLRFLKDGSIHKSDSSKFFISEEQTKLLLKFVEEKIKNIFYCLKNEKIKKQATILQKNKQITSCDYCGYSEICNKNEIITINQPINLTKEQFFENIFSSKSLICEKNKKELYRFLYYEF